MMTMMMMTNTSETTQRNESWDYKQLVSFLVSGTYSKYEKTPDASCVDNQHARWLSAVANIINSAD
jgi:hypothetical protein